MEDQQDNGTKHVWSAHETELLVECLVQLKCEGKYVADTGFGGGYVKKLEEMLEAKSPGCGLKANPHIMSRLKSMKASWQIVHEMVYGTNTSGFGWDPDKKCVTADPAVWDDYIKVKGKKKAGHFRNKCLPHFDQLTFVWGKDRATGHVSQSGPEILAEVQEENAIEQGDNSPEEEIDIDPTLPASEQRPTRPTEGRLPSRKRHRTSTE